MRVCIIGLIGQSYFYELDKLPLKGETVKASDVHTEIGGKGINQAVALSRLGVKVSFLGAIGDDADGDECKKLVKQENIKANLIVKDMHTPLATILKTKNGDNEVIVYQGSNTELDIEDLVKFEKEIISCDCLLLQYEIPFDVLKKAIAIAKQYNKKVIINPAPYIYDDLELLAKADVIIPNEIELSQILKIDKLDEETVIRKFKEYKLNNVVVTLGDKGAFVYSNGKYKYINGLKVNVVDTTGAGDVFNASLVYMLLNGKDLFTASEFANKQAALSVQRKYVLDSIPRIEE